jgi:chromate transport protein ChrA
MYWTLFLTFVKIGMFTIGGVALLGMAAFIVIRSRRQHKSER